MKKSLILLLCFLFLSAGIMSQSTKSDLSNPQYGYDMVVAVTEGAVNKTMKKFLAGYHGTEFVQAYVYKQDVGKGKDHNVPVDFDKLKKNLGFDPFTIPDGTPFSDSKIKKLVGQKFTFAFKTEIGIPNFKPGLIPDPVVFDKEGAYVKYNMVCKVFKIIVLQPSLYGNAKWINLSQANDKVPWVFGFTVDLDLQSDNINNHFHKLPPKTQKIIKDLGQNMFSVQQLFLDLNTAGLTDKFEIKGLDPTSTAYVKLISVFFDEYFAHLSKDGGVLLGYSVKADKPFPAQISLIPTDLNFEISSYKNAGKPTADYDLYTLNYLVMSKGHHMPAPVQFTWNWIEKTEAYSGVMAVKKDVFVSFINDLLSPSLQDICEKPDVKFDINCIKVVITWKMDEDTGVHKYNLVNDGTSHVLTFSYSKSDKDSDSQYCVIWEYWGNLSLDYNVVSDVYFENNIITVKTNAKAHVHINVDGGVTKGNYVNFQATSTYQIGVDAHGQFTVIQTRSVLEDNSDKVDPNWWSKFLTMDEITHMVNVVKNSLQGLVRNGLHNFSGDINYMLNSSNTWVFPGGMTFIFKGVSFSENQDLVSHIAYEE